MRKPKKTREYKKFTAERYEDPEEFDSRSFRSRKLESGDVLTFGCPKGEWDEDEEECRVGMRLQRRLRKNVGSKGSFRINLSSEILETLKDEFVAEGLFITEGNIKRAFADFLEANIEANPRFISTLVSYADRLGYTD